MPVNAENKYDISPYVAEVYDLEEEDPGDIEFIKELIGKRGPLRILEPFCGTGRVLMPLALEGHSVTGLDQARGMVARARAKIGALPQRTQDLISLVVGDVVDGPWPGDDYDLVVLTANCFYELATPEEQESCIASASRVLRRGGHLYIENGNMEGELPESWQKLGVSTNRFPTGTCSDGTRLESQVETLWTDSAKRLSRDRRTTVVHFPDGRREEYSVTVQCHPASAVDIRQWLGQHGFTILRAHSSTKGEPYSPGCGRAIFWAEKT